MSIVVNFYGGPGTGKSTTSAKTFAALKEAGVNAELAQEYVKQWAWESRVPVNYDQFYFFGKQARKEYSLFNKVDVILTDSPVALCGVYAQKYGTPQQALLFRNMVRTYLDMVAASGQEYVHIFLERVKPYNAAGRYQGEAEARFLDATIQRYLDELGIIYHTVRGDSGAYQEIIDIIGVRTEPMATSPKTYEEPRSSPLWRKSPHPYVDTTPYRGCATCGYGPGAYFHNSVNVVFPEAENHEAAKEENNVQVL